MDGADRPCRRLPRRHCGFRSSVRPILRRRRAGLRGRRRQRGHGSTFLALSARTGSEIRRHGSFRVAVSVPLQPGLTNLASRAAPVGTKQQVLAEYRAMELEATEDDDARRKDAGLVLGRAAAARDAGRSPGSPEMKHRAAELSRGYPSQARLLQILSGPGARIPPGIATVGFNAGWLLEAKNLLGQVGGTTTRPTS